MNNHLMQLLNQVAQGKTTFRPASESREELERFQATVEDLRYLTELGYIEGWSPHRDAASRYCDLVTISRGITDQGRQFLMSAV
jgi:hypothetical protein